VKDRSPRLVRFLTRKVIMYRTVRLMRLLWSEMLRTNSNSPQNAGIVGNYLQVSTKG